MYYYLCIFFVLRKQCKLSSLQKFKQVCNSKRHIIIHFQILWRIHISMHFASYTKTYLKTEYFTECYEYDTNMFKNRLLYKTMCKNRICARTVYYRNMCTYVHSININNWKPGLSNSCSMVNMVIWKDGFPQFISRSYKVLLVYFR